MANYDSNYAIAQEINERLGNSPIPFDSVYSICLEIYQELGGEEQDFDSVYSILLAILPLIEGGGPEAERLFRLIELMNSTGITVETIQTSSLTLQIEQINDSWHKQNLSAVVWGDGTFTETDGETIINGDDVNTVISVTGAGHILTHTYTMNKSYNTKVIGTYFANTFDAGNASDVVKNVSVDKGVLGIFAFCCYQTHIEHITFNEECQTLLGYAAFGYNNTINSIYLPKGIQVTSNSFSYAQSQFTDTIINEIIYPYDSPITSLTQNYNRMNSKGRYGVTKINLPPNLVSIGQYVFATTSPYENGIVNKVVFPQTLTTIGRWAFGYAFDNNAVIDLPASVTTIDGWAFGRGYYYENGAQYRCKYTLISRALVPPIAQSDSFDAVDSVKPTDCTLYVPNESLSLYQAATGWKEFGTILPLESYYVETATNAEIQELFEPLQTIL